MSLDPRSSIVLACVVMLLCLGACLSQWWRRLQASRSGRLHNLRGQRGEAQAERLLRALGYRVLGRHVRRRYGFAVDGAQDEVEVIADLLVERDGTRLVAEVKTGKWGTRLAHAETRRQLLEYQLAFAVPGILLVDIEAGRVHEVTFPWSPPRSAGAGRVRLALSVSVIAALIGAWFWSRS
jgi:Holliday junction resolvase-like predicted endonuclease